MRRFLPKSTEELAAWYQRYVSPLFLIIGFIIDNFFLLKRVDFAQTHIILVGYLCISFFGIMFENAVSAGKIRAAWAVRIYPFVPVVIQFSIGALIAGYLSLYSRSAGEIETWATVLILGLLLVGNERFYKFYTRFSFQVSLYFLALLAYLIFALPIFFKTIGVTMFLLSCALSVVGAMFMIMILAWIDPATVRSKRWSALGSVAGILAFINLLYFTNLIPPLPLAVKDAGVYHSVVRLKDGYMFKGEVTSWFDDMLHRSQFHQTPRDSALVFTSIFAPTGIETPITHEWQFYDATSSAWITKDEVTFSITGGRDLGYRGYSRKSDLEDGFWRVNVLSGSQRIGRVSFHVIGVTEAVEMEQVEK